MKRVLHLIYLISLIVIVSSPAHGKNPTNGTYDSKSEYTGYYITPTPDTLDSLSRWPLDYVKWVRSGNKIKASYYLPTLLVGEKSQKIVMKGTINPKKTFFELKGAHGSASCRISSEESFVCITKFKKLKLTEKTITSAINDLNISDEKKTSRILIAKLFRMDPIGIIIVKKR